MSYRLTRFPDLLLNTGFVSMSLPSVGPRGCGISVSGGTVSENYVDVVWYLRDVEVIRLQFGII